MAKEISNRVDGQVRAGTIVQAHTIEHLCVHAPPAEPDSPVQLPPPPVHFADRTVEQDLVLAAVAGGHGGPAADGPADGPLVVCVSGMGGIGKTELGFRLARELRRLGRCPDGVFHVDLNDLRRDGAVEVADALGGLCRSLGRGDALPAGFAERRREYWAATQDKRLALVIDNAQSGAEIRPLLPSSGAAVVIVTSHARLADLDGTRSVDLPLGPLSGEDATGLLRAAVQDPRLVDDPQAAAELAGCCAGLPAAILVAGRLLRKRRNRDLRRLIDELTAGLREEGVPVVEAVWNAAYARLGPAAARLYRALPHHPGPVVTVPVAAALLGSGLDRAEDAVDELEEAGLLLRRPGGLGMHDLLRGHALRRADAGAGAGADAGADAGAGVDAPGDVRRRLVRWLRRQAARADLLAAGSRLTVSGPAPEEPGLADVPDLEFTDKHAAMHWLEREHLSLFGCVRIAHEDGLDDDAVALCEPLWTHFLDHQHYADVIDAFRHGLASAQRADSTAGIVRMHCQLARPLWEQGRYPEARQEVEAAIRRGRLLGERDDERKLYASAIEFRGKLASVQGNWAVAVPDFEAAREVHRAIGNEYGAMLQTYLIGRGAVAMGELDRAVELLSDAHETALRLGRDRMSSRTGFELGVALRRTGRREEAARLYEAALAGARARRSAADELRVLETLVAFCEEGGDAARAEGYRAEVAEIAGHQAG
ncbi:NB-ARC domain-containing protein [Kitasatospora sp. NPDC059722]|uniref:NB-ARC domain-containing protein n=1 Tax=Kitasatospora sp. NPDC059722 TaxID=3346925 RepID=UPI0036CAA8C4